MSKETCCEGVSTARCSAMSACLDGHKVVATGAVYCATKHEVRAISEGLRQEVKDYPNKALELIEICISE